MHRFCCPLFVLELCTVCAVPTVTSDVLLTRASCVNPRPSLLRFGCDGVNVGLGKAYCSDFEHVAVAELVYLATNSRDRWADELVLRQSVKLKTKCTNTAFCPSH